MFIMDKDSVFCEVDTAVLYTWHTTDDEITKLLPAVKPLQQNRPRGNLFFKLSAMWNSV